MANPWDNDPIVKAAGSNPWDNDPIVKAAGSNPWDNDPIVKAVSGKPQPTPSFSESQQPFSVAPEATPMVEQPESNPNALQPKQVTPKNSQFTTEQPATTKAPLSKPVATDIENPAVITSAVKNRMRQFANEAKVIPKIIGPTIDAVLSLTGNEENPEQKGEAQAALSNQVQESADYWKLTSEDKKQLQSSGPIGQAISGAIESGMQTPEMVLSGSIIGKAIAPIVDGVVSKYGVDYLSKNFPTITKILTKAYGIDKSAAISKGITEAATNYGTITTLPTENTATEKGIPQALKDLPENAVQGIPFIFTGPLAKAAPEALRPLTEPISTAAGTIASSALSTGSFDDALIQGVSGLLMHGQGEVLNLPRAAKAAKVYSKNPTPERKASFDKIINQELSNTTPEQLDLIKNQIADTASPEAQGVKETKQPEPLPTPKPQESFDAYKERVGITADSPRLDEAQAVKDGADPEVAFNKYNNQPNREEVSHGQESEKGQEKTNAADEITPETKKDNGASAPSYTPEQIAHVEELRKQYAPKQEAASEDQLSADEMLWKKNQEYVDNLKKLGYIYDEGKKRYVQTDPATAEAYWSNFGRDRLTNSRAPIDDTEIRAKSRSYSRGNEAFSPEETTSESGDIKPSSKASGSERLSSHESQVDISQEPDDVKEVIVNSRINSWLNSKTAEHQDNIDRLQNQISIQESIPKLTVKFRPEDLSHAFGKNISGKDLFGFQSNSAPNADEQRVKFVDAISKTNGDLAQKIDGMTQDEFVQWAVEQHQGKQNIKNMKAELKAAEESRDNAFSQEEYTAKINELRNKAGLPEQKRTRQPGEDDEEPLPEPAEQEQPLFQPEQQQAPEAPKETVGQTDLLGETKTLEQLNAEEKTQQERQQVKEKQAETKGGEADPNLPLFRGTGAVEGEHTGLFKEGESESKSLFGNPSGAVYVPGLKDLKTAAKTMTEAFNAVEREANIIFDPGNVNGASKETEAVLRESNGRMDRANDRLNEALKGASKFFEKRTKEQNLNFIYKLEAGEKQDTPEEQLIANQFRKWLDGKREEIQKLGTGKLDKFIENYFPHIWERPGAVKQMMQGKRPLFGAKDFLKQRTIEDTKKGIELGFVPVSYNPIDLAMLKIREMNKYLMAAKTIESLKNSGIVKFVKLGKEKPEGYIEIDDAFAEVYSKNEKGELVLRGRYYMHPDGARVLNNYLSPGLRGNVFYDLYRGAGNYLNQAQLGLSAFHAGFTTMEAIASKAALGAYKIANGHVLKGLADFAQVPLGPVAAITNVMRGDKLYKAWLGKGHDDQVKFMADLMASAGGKAKMDDFYSTRFAGSIKKAFQDGHYVKGILKTPFWLTEQMSRPIMEYLVPRQKLGIFSDMMQFEIEKNPSATHEELRAISQKIWNSVDNRLGQLVYDNLFWNKTGKDLAMASVRSVGWNLGTIREIGGGLQDAAKFASPGEWIRAAKGEGEKPKFTYKMSYVAMLPVVAGLYGAMYQYLKTGKGPQELKDYYFPKTGGFDKNSEPARSSLPTYMKDVYHYRTAPFETILNKFGPVNNTVIEMLTNKDFYGTEIRGLDDPIMKQVFDEAKFAGQQFEPFGIRNMNKDTNKSLEQKIEPFVGITPAPYDINMTTTEKKAREMEQAKREVGARTKEQSQHSQLKAGLINEYKLSKDTKPLDQALAEKKISDRDKTDIIKESKMSPIERYAQNLSHAQITYLLKTANPKEKEQLLSNGRYITDEYLREIDAAKPSDRKLIQKQVPTEISKLPQEVRKKMAIRYLQGIKKINKREKLLEHGEEEPQNIDETISE